MIDFNLFNKTILEKKNDNVTDESKLVRVFSAAINAEGMDTIDFDSFDIEDIHLAVQGVFEAVRSDDDDEMVYLSTNFRFGQINALQHKIHALELTRKHRVPSSFRFL